MHCAPSDSSHFFTRESDSHWTFHSSMICRSFGSTYGTGHWCLSSTHSKSTV
uniref:Uncharacterized protein n=1 Tax=Anguilla anguilla TaxID=7936 RepID=A0A0E9W6Q1_ANGAN